MTTTLREKLEREIEKYKELNKGLHECIVDLERTVGLWKAKCKSMERAAKINPRDTWYVTYLQESLKRQEELFEEQLDQSRQLREQNQEYKVVLESVVTHTHTL